MSENPVLSFTSTFPVVIVKVDGILVSKVVVPLVSPPAYVEREETVVSKLSRFVARPLVSLESNVVVPLVSPPAYVERVEIVAFTSSTRSLPIEPDVVKSLLLVRSCHIVVAIVAAVGGAV